MKRILTYIILTVSLCLGALPVLQAAAPDKHTEQLLQRADSLVSKYKETEALQLYEQILEQVTDHYEALCKASQLHIRIGNRFSDDTRKGEHFNKAKGYALRAYILNPSDAESNFLMALSLSHLATLAGPRQKFAMYKEIKTHLDAALAQNQNHAQAWHLLGRWQYKMANLNFAEVAATRIFLASSPESSSTSEAIYSLNKAIACNPQAIQYYFDLALIYQDVKESESCVNVLERALTLTTLETKEELELSRRCKIMLDDLSKKEQAY